MRYRHYWNQGKRRKAVCFGNFWLLWPDAKWSCHGRSYASWTMLWNTEKCEFAVFRRFAEPLCIPTAAASIPVLHIGQSFKNMALCRVWTVLEEDAMIMRDVKASGQGWKKNCFIIETERQNITKWKNWNSWSGGISWVTGATAGSARQSVESHQL